MSLQLRPAHKTAGRLALVLWSLGASTLRAEPLRDARSLQAALRYDEATAQLESRLDGLQGEARGQALVLLAELSTDHKDARRLLLAALEHDPSAATRRAAVLELVKLDYARGNYNSVISRLREVPPDAETERWLARANVALGKPEQALTYLRGHRRDAAARLLAAWADMQGGHHDVALPVLEELGHDQAFAGQPTALLWATQCNVALGRRDAALALATQLQGRFPLAPEATLVDATLSAVRGETDNQRSDIEASPGDFVLQMGAFEERTNALRFRHGLPSDLEPVQVVEVIHGMRRLYRVQVGPFGTRDLAIAYGHAHCDPIDVEWSVARSGAP